MTKNHPITPPPELVQQWMSFNNMDIAPVHLAQALATQAARWGSDQELEACCAWLSDHNWRSVKPALRAARRPKPPSLKEQAKFAAAVLRSPDETCSIAELQQHWHTICKALEQLND